MNYDYFEPSRNSKVTVGTSSVHVLDKKDRKALVLTNRSTGAQVITINQGETAAIANEGIILAPGQSYVDSDSGSYMCWRGNVQAISTAADAILSIFER